MPVQLNLRYDRSGPKPRQKEGPVVVNNNRFITVMVKEPTAAPRQKEPTLTWSLDLPGTDFFSMLFQATSSRQMSSIKVLVTTEMPGAPTAEALWDMGTRSAAVVSKPTWGITRSQAEIRSIGRQAETRLHQLETKWRELPRQSGLPLYMWCELTTSQVRLVQEPKQRRKNCKQYLKPWQGWICACVLERTGRGSVGTCGGVIRCWSKFLSWVVFDILVRLKVCPSFEHQKKNLFGNPTKKK